MFRRDTQPDGTPYRYEVAGLWGSGNTITERELIVDEENTVYTMWDGRGLKGPRRGEYVHKYEGLWGVMSLGDVEARYAGKDCAVMIGEEPGSGCDTACGNVRDLCDDEAGAQCLDRCTSGLPQATIDCLGRLDECAPQRCPTP